MMETLLGREICPRYAFGRPYRYLLSRRSTYWRLSRPWSGRWVYNKTTKEVSSDQVSPVRHFSNAMTREPLRSTSAQRTREFPAIMGHCERDQHIKSAMTRELPVLTRNSLSSIRESAWKLRIAEINHQRFWNHSPNEMLRAAPQVGTIYLMLRSISFSSG